MDLDRELRRVAAVGAHILTWEDEAYPRLLAEIPDPPPILYIRGELKPEDAWAVAVVGTRRASTYGREVTRRLVSVLAQSGVTIVSGLARGVDAVAHQTALEAGGRTIAVLGCGIDLVYPPEHRELARRIAARGALVTEYPPGTPPEPGNFPPRNRIISGLSLGIVITEAGRDSGPSSPPTTPPSRAGTSSPSPAPFSPPVAPAPTASSRTAPNRSWTQPTFSRN